MPGVPCWIETWHPEPGPAVSFYTGLFGWQAENTLPADADRTFHVCKLRGRDVAAIGSPLPEAAPPTPVWTTYVQVESAEETAAKASEAGGSVPVGPVESLDRGRLAFVADPSGAVVGAWEQGDHGGAQVINEPGAWSMSILNTRDPEGSKAFYGSLFGWETETFDMGGAGIELFRLPGFEGGEPSQPVPRDVVAVMIEMDSHGMPKELPSHWSVDFWIADADEAAAKAPQLGGAVVMPPSDTPAFREAVLTDPGGAAFTVSQLKLG